jgi:O-antigen ligase
VPAALESGPFASDPNLILLPETGLWGLFGVILLVILFVLEMVPKSFVNGPLLKRRSAGGALAGALASGTLRG